MPVFAIYNLFYIGEIVCVFMRSGSDYNSDTCKAHAINVSQMQGPNYEDSWQNGLWWSQIYTDISNILTWELESLRLPYWQLQHFHIQWPVWELELRPIWRLVSILSPLDKDIHYPGKYKTWTCTTGLGKSWQNQDQTLHYLINRIT